MPSDKRNAAIEAMAEALYRDSAKEQSDARTWAEMKAEHPADYEGVTRFYSRAAAALDALLAALPALGLRVVPVEMTRDMMLAAMDRSPDGDTLYHGIHQESCADALNVLGRTDGE